MRVGVDGDDIKLVSKATRYSKAEVRAMLVDGSLPTPCPLLSGQDCTIYRKRPKACRSFPWVADTWEAGMPCPTLNIGCPAAKALDLIGGIK